jgi:hypothetical protein
VTRRPLMLLALAAACSPPAENRQAPEATRQDVSMAPTATCRLEQAGGGDVAVLRGGCRRTAVEIAATLRPEAMAGVSSVTLGRTPFADDGVYDRCDLLARLARDPRWTATIDSAGAQPVLTETLNAMTLAAPIAAALGRPVRVSTETVLLAPRGPECPVAPAQVPTEALLTLELAR